MVLSLCLHSGKFYLQTVASKSLWPEYEISNEDECDEVADDHAHSTSLVSASQADETYNSLLDSFEVAISIPLMLK